MITTERQETRNDNGAPEPGKVASVAASEKPKPEESVEANDPNGGMASETAGRENADLYENDVFGRIDKRRREGIWARGNEKRTRHGRRKRSEEDE